MPLDLDKSDWKPVTFGDVVSEVRQSTKDPVADGIERVVGLEHIEPECIHLHNWVSIEEETTFTKTFRKGHVLFGRRRAYLKKAAQAEFDGICSGDITVMEATDDLLPELLPFLVCNDKFFDYAVQHSAGGLSPRTKFKDLANYEFLIPTKDQQVKLAELLWAADATIVKNSEATLALQTCLNSFRASFLGSQKESPHKIVQIADIGATDRQSVQVGPFGGSVTSSHFVPTGVPVIKINNLTENDSLDLSKLVYVSKEHAASLERYKIKSGDILTAAQATTGRSALADDRVADSLISQHLIRVAFDTSQCLPEFALEVFSSDLIKRQIHVVKAKTTRDGLNTDDVSSFWFPLPEIQQQREFVAQISQMKTGLARISENRFSTSNLLKSLLNQIF